jgi:hypothetical protein
MAQQLRALATHLFDPVQFPAFTWQLTTSIAPVLGNKMVSIGLQRSQTDIHAGKNTHTHKINNSYFQKIKSERINVLL